MKYGRRSPCAHCPFRTDIPGFLRRARAADIVRGLRDPNGGEFPCHETMPRTDSPSAKVMVCAGSVLVTERDQGPNQMHRISQRVGAYDPATLDRTAPCFADLDAFVAHHGNAMDPPKKKTPVATKLRSRRK